MFRYDQLEDGVAEKLEALIIHLRTLPLVPHTRMGERLPEQFGITKLMGDALFQWMHNRRR